MASSASVQSFAKRASTELERIDGLVANAGVMIDAWSTAEGMETSVTVNVINTLFLGAFMMPKMSESGRKFGTHPTIVFVLVEKCAVRQFAALYPVESTGVIVNMVASGLCSTGLGRNVRTFTKIMHETVRAMMARTAEVGSRTILHGLVAGEESHGKLLSDCKIKEYWVPDWVSNAEGQRLQRDIWKELVARLEEIQPRYISQLLQT
ncbi:MAG: hypothetical protein Q9172_001208 [Xanthocarpia lactea]